MSNLLVLTSSALGEASVSNKLVEDTVTALGQLEPGLTITRRDLGSDPIPHLTGETLAAFGGNTSTPARAAAAALSDKLIGELKAADTVLIGAPMYNFGIPSTLKTWFDLVLRAGLTFRYTETGPQGLLSGKNAVIVETRGGFYSEGPARAMDAQEPHLSAMLGLMGIDDVEFIRAERLALGDDPRQAAIEAASAALGDFAASRLTRAA